MKLNEFNRTKIEKIIIKTIKVNDNNKIRFVTSSSDEMVDFKRRGGKRSTQ